MKKKYNVFSIIFLVTIFFFHLKGDPAGIILYGDNEGLKYRIYDTQNGIGQEQSVPGITMSINFIRAAACPTRSEVMVLALSNSGTLYCSTWTSTGGWAESPRIIRSGGDTNNRWFDVVYTKNGEAIIVYSDGTTDLKYVIWNGYWWEIIRSVGNLHDSGKTPVWVTLASCPTRNEVICVYSNKDNRWGFASVWISSGPIRGFVTDYNVIIKSGSVADSDAREGITVTYESSSGEGVVMYNNSGISARVWDGTQWGSVITGSGATPNHISTKPKPTGNTILVCYNGQGSGNTYSRLWNGDNNSWGSETVHNNMGGTALCYMIDGDWEITSGHEDHYLIVSWVQSGGSYLQAGLLAKIWNGTQFDERYPVVGTSGITYSSVYLKTLTRIQGTASSTIQLLSNTGSTLNAWDYNCHVHNFDSGKQDIESYLSRTTFPHQSFAMVALYSYTPPDTTPPSAINDLQAQPGTNPGEITLTWSATGDDGTSGSITGGQYRLRYSTYVSSDPNFWTSGTWSDPQNKYELVWSTNTTPFEPQRIVIQNLIEGVLYYFRIWLRDDSNNWSQPSNQTSSYPKPTQDTTPPAKIENVSLTAGPNGSQITVIWQATGDDGTIKNIVDGMYRIRYSTYTQLDWSSNIGWTQPGIRYQIEVSTNVTSGTYQTVILSGLIEGVTYYMRIWLRDENTDNWSEMSDIFSTYAKTEPPSPITDLKAEGFFFGIKEGEVRLSWTAVGDNGNIGIAAQYIIKVSTLSNINDDMGFSKAQLLSDFSNVVIPEPQQSGTKQTLLITGLIPGVSYYFAIKVKDNAGLLSQWYRDTVVNTENYAMAFDESPPSVTNLSITELDKQLILQWNYNFATVKDFSHFIVYCDSTPPILWDNSFVIGQTTSTYLNITNLENGVLYNFKVIAVDMLPFVLESQPEIIYGTPNISIPLAATDFTGIAVSTTTILWKWKYNSSNVNYYSIYNSTGGLLIENPIEPPIPEYGEWEETDLSPNTSSYVSYIILTNLVGNSQPCYVSSTVFTFANPPSNVSLVMISSIVYRLTFSQNGNSTITRYAIYLSTDNVEYRKVKDLEDNFTISNLPLDLVFEPDNTYFLKLKAYNQQGIPSDEIIFSTGTYDEIPPAKVTDLTIQLSENPAEVVAKWTSSGDNGDKKILFGKIEIRWSNNPLHTWDLMPQNNRIVISTVSTPGEIQSFNISGLAYNTTFYFYIKLIDDYGNISEVSNKATIYIPEPSKIPNFVAGIKITQKNQNSITINWSKVTKNKDGSICNDIIAYKIYKSTISFENVQLIGQANSNVFYYTDTNYTQSSLSYYTVRAVNSLNVEGQSIMYVNSEGTVIFLGDIPEVRVEIPYASSSVLYKLENIFDEDLIVKVASKSISGYILNYDINFYGYDTLSRYEVSLPPVGVSILCAIKNHLLDELQVYYWLNDKETLLITDIEKIKTYNVIKINAAKLGLFSFKKEKLLDTEITIEKTKPRIITPLSNDENYNKATIYINNFQKQPVIKTRVYDLRGSLIIDNLKEEKKDFIYSWDGRDKNGEIVADGPYIYEIHISNKILRGIIIVAR